MSFTPTSTHALPSDVCDAQPLAERSSPTDLAIGQGPLPQAKTNEATGNCGIAPSSAQAKGEEAGKTYAIATKADDAAVPVHLWDRRALGLTEEDEDLGLCLKTVELRAVQSRALNALQ